MKRVLLLVIVVFSVSSLATAQDAYKFEYRKLEKSEVEAPFYKEHFLGDEVAEKMQLLKESYTYKVYNEVSQANVAVIEKQPIFFSVNKVSKYLKKQIKKGGMTESQAKEVMNNVLSIALNIRYQETEKLETELWKMKDPEAIAKLFDERISLGM